MYRFKWYEEQGFDAMIPLTSTSSLSPHENRLDCALLCMSTFYVPKRFAGILIPHNPGIEHGTVDATVSYHVADVFARRISE
jgi:hypothetical protein